MHAILWIACFLNQLIFMGAISPDFYKPKVLKSGKDHSSRFVHAVLSLPYDGVVNISATFRACKNVDCSIYNEAGYVENIFDHSNPNVTLTNVFANIFELTYALERPYSRIQTILETETHITSEIHFSCRAGYIPTGVDECSKCPRNTKQVKNVCENCEATEKSPPGSWRCMGRDQTGQDAVRALEVIMNDVREENIAENDEDLTLDEETKKLEEWVEPKTIQRNEKGGCESNIGSPKQIKRQQWKDMLDVLRARSDFNIRQVKFTETLARDKDPVGYSAKLVKAARQKGASRIIRQPGEENKNVPEVCEQDVYDDYCCTGLFNESSRDAFVLETGEQVGSWAVLCNTDNHPYVKIKTSRLPNRQTQGWFDSCGALFDVWCWHENRWTGHVTNVRDNSEFICEGREFIIGSIGIVPDNTTIPEGHCDDITNEWGYWDCCVGDRVHTNPSCVELYHEFEAHDCCEQSHAALQEAEL